MPYCPQTDKPAIRHLDWVTETAKGSGLAQQYWKPSYRSAGVDWGRYSNELSWMLMAKCHQRCHPHYKRKYAPHDRDSRTSLPLHPRSPHNTIPR
ncbi:MAG: hypothetical protein Alpg2KO_00010 [Alphaproteobacteria bacterium]